MPLYDSIGKTYNFTRKADSRIVTALLKLLVCKPPSLIADIGAGTGNYSFALAENGYRIDALEPSAVMREQARNHPDISWTAGTAEDMPFQNGVYTAVISTLAVHHFTSLDQGLQEMWRILQPGGQLLLFTIDPRIQEKKCWIREYFGYFYPKAYSFLLPVGEMIRKVEQLSGNQADVVPFKLPPDFTDGVFHAGWQKPELYLDRHFRQGISVFAMVEEAVIIPMIEQLAHDLADGTWERKYGFVRYKPVYESGFYFLSVNKDM